MKHLLLTTIAAVVLVGCGGSIHDAAVEGNIEAVKQHLAAGTDVNAKVKDGSTPLHLAAVKGHKEIVELLIAKGADVNAKGKGEMTPLHIAANKEVAELLIAKGADVNAKMDNGSTPLNWAMNLNQKETADLLRKHGGKTGDWLKVGDSIHIAAKVGHIEAVRQHLAAGTDVNTAGGRWRRVPLHEAAREGHKEIAALLIAAGADVNAQTNSGRTPLHDAAVNGHKEVAELLIAKGADVNAKSEDGETPLDWANGEIANLLRKHGGKTGEELKAEGK